MLYSIKAWSLIGAGTQNSTGAGQPQPSMTGSMMSNASSALGAPADLGEAAIGEVGYGQDYQLAPAVSSKVQEFIVICTGDESESEDEFVEGTPPPSPKVRIH